MCTLKNISHKLQENFMEILGKNKADKVRHFSVTDSLHNVVKKNWAKLENIFWGKEKMAECPVVAIGTWGNVVKIFGQNFDNIFGGKEKKTE